MKKLLFLSAILLMFTLQLDAQHSHSHGTGRGVKPSQTEIEELQTKRADYITKEMKLTVSESEAFVPILNKYMAAKFHVYRIYRNEVRDFKSKSTKDAGAYDKEIDRYLTAEAKKADLEKEFYQNIRKILPAEKVYLFRIAEHKYMHKTLDNQKKGE